MDNVWAGLRGDFSWIITCLFLAFLLANSRKIIKLLEDNNQLLRKLNSNNQPQNENKTKINEPIKSWKCPVCGTENTDKICKKCGIEK